eukprot:2752546-Rhodomonas_salina.1
MRYVVLRCPCALCGTEKGYGAMQCSVRGQRTVLCSMRRWLGFFAPSQILVYFDRIFLYQDESVLAH